MKIEVSYGWDMDRKYNVFDNVEDFDEWFRKFLDVYNGEFEAVDVRIYGGKEERIKVTKEEEENDR